MRHCPTPALTPERVVAPSSSSSSSATFSASSAVSSFSSTTLNRTVDSRDDLAQKAVARAQSMAQAQLLQAEKDRFVNGLVGASVLAIESIWGPSTPAPSASTTQFATPSSVLPLHYFVREVLRRSRTSCSTLQLSLYYLHKSRRQIRDAVQRAESSRAEIAMLARDRRGEHERVVTSVVNPLRSASEAELVDAFLSSSTCAVKLDDDVASAYPSPPDSPDESAAPVADESIGERFTRLVECQKSPLLCGRRMFLASLICASKYLQDRNYSNKAWAKISGLAIAEINANERTFLELVGWELHLEADDFKRWTERLSTLTSMPACAAAVASTASTSTTSTLRQHGLSRSASEYLPTPPATIPIASTSTPRPATSNLARSKLALTRGNSAPQLGPSSVSSVRTKKARGGFPIAQPHSVTKSKAVPVVVVTEDKSSDVDTTEEEDNAEKKASVPAVVEARKVRALPVRRSKVVYGESNCVPSSWGVAGVQVGGSDFAVGRTGDLIRAH